MAQIRYAVPYQIDVRAKDLTSGNRIGTTFHYRNGAPAAGPPPAYGSLIPVSSTSVMLANFKTQYENMFALSVTTNYVVVDYTMRAIIGWGYTTPFVGIVAVVTGNPTLIQSALPHGLVTGDLVNIAGVTSPVGLNGLWIVTVINLHQFTVEYDSTASAWTGPGTIQKVTGAPGFVYADKEVLASTAAGEVADENLPIYATASVQRFNEGTGKSFRSRFSMSCIPEGANEDGVYTTIAYDILVNDLATMMAGVNNNATDAGMAISYMNAVSKLKASQSFTPFGESSSWCKVVTSLIPHHRFGSQVQRKPRLAGT